MGKGSSIEYSELSDIGRRRSNNQDSKEVLPPSNSQQYRQRGWLFLVADGMGAHAAGEMASAMAAQRVPLVYEKHASRSPPYSLRFAIEEVNREINTKGENNPDFRGMGTTCTTLAIVPRGAIVGHVGDSRCYRIRGTKVEQISRDHSLVWELESAGGMTREQANQSAPKNIITRSMGPHPKVDVDLEGPLPVELSDTFVLCSDGLSGQVSDEEIGLLASLLTPKMATRALVGLTLVRGSPDNVTVIVARAGVEQVTAVSSSDAPWPMSEPVKSDETTKSAPWIAVGVSLVSLFFALILQSPSVQQNLPAIPAGSPFWTIASLIMVAISLGSGLVASISWSTGPVDNGRFLPVGGRLGKGPYRDYDCTPTSALFNGIISSVDEIVSGLDANDQTQIASLMDDARKKVENSAFQEAMMPLCDALEIYYKAIERSRGSETTHGSSAN